MNVKCDYCDYKAVVHKDVGYLCSKHYMQYYRHGKVFNFTTRDKNEILFYGNYAEIVIRNIKSEEVCRVKVDLDDVDKIKDKTWSLQANNYIAHGAPPLYLHRFILGAKSDEEVDHVNGDKLDNRKCNIRFVTHGQNMFNQNKLRSSNTTGCIGVRVYSANGKYIARITVNKKIIHLGYFSDLKEAIKARIKAEKQYFGKFMGSNKKFEYLLNK